MWNNRLIPWQISIHNYESSERSPPLLKLLLLQQPIVKSNLATQPHKEFAFGKFII